jgi:flavodoxin
MMKNVLIAYMSYFGNSRSCAECFRSELESRDIGTELISIKDGETPAEEWDTVVIFSPVRMGNIVGKTRRFVRKLNYPGKRFALVISHGADIGRKFSPVKPAEKLRKRMSDKGMLCASKPVYVKVASGEGPLVEGYDMKLRELADTLQAF